MPYPHPIAALVRASISGRRNSHYIFTLAGPFEQLEALHPASRLLFDSPFTCFPIIFQFLTMITLQSLLTSYFLISSLLFLNISYLTLSHYSHRLLVTSGHYHARSCLNPFFQRNHISHFPFRRFLVLIFFLLYPVFLSLGQSLQHPLLPKFSLSIFFLYSYRIQSFSHIFFLVVIAPFLLLSLNLISYFL